MAEQAPADKVEAAAGNKKEEEQPDGNETGGNGETGAGNEEKEEEPKKEAGKKENASMMVSATQPTEEPEKNEKKEKRLLVPAHSDLCDFVEPEKTLADRVKTEETQNEAEATKARTKADEAREKLKDSRWNPQWRRAHFYRMIKNMITLSSVGFITVVGIVFAMILSEVHCNDILGFNNGSVTGLGIVIFRFQDILKKEDMTELKWWIFMSLFSACVYAVVRIYLERFELRQRLLSLHCERRYQKTQALQELRRYAADRTWEDIIYADINTETAVAEPSNLGKIPVKDDADDK